MTLITKRISSSSNKYGNSLKIKVHLVKTKTRIKLIKINHQIPILDKCKKENKRAQNKQHQR